MPIVQLLGKVHPRGFNVSIGGMRSVHWNAEELNLEMDFKIQIANSEVRVECQTNYYQPTCFMAIYIRALDLARGAVNLCGFAMGIGTTVTLDTFIGPAGDTLPYIPQQGNLAGICTAYSLGNLSDGSFNTILNLVLLEPSLSGALNDLVSAISQIHEGPTRSACAIERLRHLIAPNLSTKDQWEALRQNLQLDKAYVEFVTDLSKGPRHGDPQHISGGPTVESARRAWVIMNRYLEYRKRGSVALPISEFPMLTG
jgi:hypothetical protein